MATLTALLRELEPMTAPLNAYVARLEAGLTALLREHEPTIEALSADGRAHKYAQRHEESGTAIPYDDAVRLACGLMAFRIPYTEDQRDPEEGGISTVRDFEMMAVWSERAGTRESLVEESRSSPLAFHALQRVVDGIRETDEPMPPALSEWALDFATGTLEFPKAGPGRSPYTNQIRNAVIVRTIRALVDAGLTATHNEVSAPESACDAVSRALQVHGEPLGYAAVAKIWSKRSAAAAMWMDELLAGLGYAAKG